MNQSAILTAALMVAFGLFLASRKRLSTYARILWGDKPDTHSTDNGKDEDGFSFPDVTDLLPGFSLPDLSDYIPDFNPDVENAQ